MLERYGKILPVSCSKRKQAKQQDYTMPIRKALNSKLLSFFIRDIREWSAILRESFKKMISQ
jgi:hypothetical protein